MTETFVYQHNKLGQEKSGFEFLVQDSRFLKMLQKLLYEQSCLVMKVIFLEKIFIDMVLYKP